jgi:predicted P-loop ATPase
LIARLAENGLQRQLEFKRHTKDKTAAEKLQGYWILEIGELAGLKKAEVETLRSFLSRQNDIYRAAFANRATPHLRAVRFLRHDERRIRLSARYHRQSPLSACKNAGRWNTPFLALTVEDVRQIWAEVLVICKARRKKLYLDSDIERLAKAVATRGPWNR